MDYSAVQESYDYSTVQDSYDYSAIQDMYTNFLFQTCRGKQHSLVTSRAWTIDLS